MKKRKKHSRAKRRETVEPRHPSLSAVRQCAVSGISCSSLFHRPERTQEEDFSLMGMIDRQYRSSRSLSKDSISNTIIVGNRFGVY